MKDSRFAGWKKWSSTAAVTGLPSLTLATWIFWKLPPRLVFKLGMKSWKAYLKKEKPSSTTLKSTKNNGKAKRTKPSKPLAPKTSTSNSNTSTRLCTKCKKSNKKNNPATNKSDCSKIKLRPSSKSSNKSTNGKSCFSTTRTSSSESRKRKRPASVINNLTVLRLNADKTSRTLKRSSRKSTRCSWKTTKKWNITWPCSTRGSISKKNKPRKSCFNSFKKNDKNSPSKKTPKTKSPTNSKPSLPGSRKSPKGTTPESTFWSKRQIILLRSSISAERKEKISLM